MTLASNVFQDRARHLIDDILSPDDSAPASLSVDNQLRAATVLALLAVAEELSTHRTPDQQAEQPINQQPRTRRGIGQDDLFRSLGDWARLQARKWDGAADEFAAAVLEEGYRLNAANPVTLDSDEVQRIGREIADGTWRWHTYWTTLRQWARDNIATYRTRSESAFAAAVVDHGLQINASESYGLPAAIAKDKAVQIAERIWNDSRKN